MPASNDSLLTVEDLCVGYDGDLVLRDISLEVRRGQFACLIGPNGAGKSTLLKAVMGLVPVREGRITSHARRIGYVPQLLTVEQGVPVTVAEFLSLKAGTSRFWFGQARSLRKRIESALAEIEATHLIDRQLSKLSGGEYQRILIAYALLNDPDLLLLDEPLTGVDIRGGLTFDGLLHHLHDHRGITILMVSHDMHLVEHLSDVVFCINSTLCCHGHPDEILKPENLAKAYGHLPGVVRGTNGGAFIPVKSIH